MKLPAYFLLLFTCAISCNEFSLSNSKKQIEFDQSFTEFDGYFEEIGIYPGTDTLNCTSLLTPQFGISPDTVPSELFPKLVGDDLLELIHFDEGFLHFELGKLNFGDSLIAYLFHSMQDKFRQSCGMLIFDQRTGSFVNSHSLNYEVTGENTSSIRKAWIVDLNQDTMWDIVYRRNKLIRIDSVAEPNFSDTLFVEVWEGQDFVDYTNFSSDELKEAFRMLE